ncbi:MAG: M48 family metalloprotease [Proteobacteria bacterium]|nr:M48 family metalloprotease [Pseudomonadota bacterium]
MDDEIIPTLERVVSELIGNSWNGPTVRIGILATADRNAYVLASGHVYVTSGILDAVCTTDELAAIVAHELAHLESTEDFDSRGRTLDERLQSHVCVSPPGANGVARRNGQS